MTCSECKDRQAVCKGVCKRCYQRAAAARRPWAPCECGCGGLTQGPRFIAGHNTRLLSPREQRRRGLRNDGSAQRDRGEGRGYRKIRGRHEHRIVAEQKLGRKLRKGEIVHHINGDRRDNRPENLEVMTQSDHIKRHHREGAFK